MLAVPAAAEEDDEDELPDYRPGLVATYEAPGVKSIVRRDDDVQFVWRDGSPDPRLPSGPFSARWQGRLFVISPGEYQLHIHAQGKVRLKLAEKSVLEQTLDEPQWLASNPLKLEYGYHPLELTFESSGGDARLGLYWSGPQFELEPITERNLVHDPVSAPDESFEHGRLLARALRCDACHGDGKTRLTAPDLTRVSGNLSPGWLVDWLTAEPNSAASDQPIDHVARRMPHFGLSQPDAEAIAAYLFSSSEKPVAAFVRIPPSTKSAPKQKKPTDKPKSQSKKNAKPRPRTEPSAAEGRNLLDTVGCLACHSVGERGQAALFGGGDLSSIADKRPADFFVRWLKDPATINRAHRMPVFKLSDLERQDLALYLNSLKGRIATKPAETPKDTTDLVEHGRQLVGQWRCGACHQLPQPAGSSMRQTKGLAAGSRWDNGCLTGADAAKHRPAYGLSKAQRRAVQSYYSQLPAGSDQIAAIDGQFVLAERNCLGCHARGLAAGIAGQSGRLTAARPDLAPLLAALAPPSLAGVGDKLHDEALQSAILIKNPPLRPWLKIHMPRFPLLDDEMRAIVATLVDHDRIPALPEPPAWKSSDPVRALAGSRLVTSDGFGCTSCHKIGSSEPVNVTLAAHGTDLSLVGTRIRRPWFDRWVRNPARIVPRMEMPAIQLPVRGVLGDALAEQLAAVWDVLNTDGFEPPLPNPVRVVRTRNLPDKPEPAVVLTDLIEVGKQTFLRPIVIGLPNRQNILFDLETNRLAAWWIGDTARQRTRGKSWYWEAGGPSLLPASDGAGGGELRLKYKGKWIEPTRIGQVAVELLDVQHVQLGAAFQYRLEFEDRANNLFETFDVSQLFRTMPSGETTFVPEMTKIDTTAKNFFRSIAIMGTSGAEFLWLPLSQAGAHSRSDAATTLLAERRPGISVTAISPHFNDNGGIRIVIPTAGPRGQGVATVVYASGLEPDQFPIDPVPLPADEPAKLKVVPGHEAVRLPLARDEMPTGLAWRPDGTLVISSLKGRVCLLYDTNGDGLEDQIKPFSDDLAAPYGVNCTGDAVDVINKFGLLRLYDTDHDGRAEKTEVLADGWGYSADYHDWAVGLPRDAKGNYYIGLPCQQDERTEAEAKLRGWALKLVPREPTDDDPRRYRVEPFAGGLRFPMGLALNKAGELFATDNQGNYTPFNELNHLVPGARYGFINKLEVKPGFSPPFNPPAIDIPHPWTRSINGICFLYTPEAVQQQLGRPLFGPFEGQLVGCEYNNRALVRMSLEKIGNTYQGAVYPFSRPAVEGEETFEGPVVCAIAPDGDLYIGNLRDSAWGGGQNTGSIVRLRPEGELPPGIAEVKANADGFTLHFTQPIDRAKLGDHKHYAISSYRRIPTPAYGGADVDTKPARIRSLAASDDGRSVRLVLDEMRPGFVYELRISGIEAGGKPLFPAEAYYTLRQLPR